MVLAILYDVFREADATKNALLIRSAQEEGRLITLALRPMLSNAAAPSTDLADVLGDFAAGGRSIKPMFRPAGAAAAGFFYLAAYPPVPPACRQQERNRPDRPGTPARPPHTTPLPHPPPPQ